MSRPGVSTSVPEGRGGGGSRGHLTGPVADESSKAGRWRPVFWGCFAVYLAIRLFAWHGAVLVEDHGSISQLFRAETFLSLDLRRITTMEPDSTPLYPAFIALLAWPGWPLELIARLCSLLFSVLLFFCVARIGERIIGPRGTAAGLLLLALNPVLGRLSIAILTEPSYIATVYLGLWLLLRQYEQPRLRTASVLGIVFGLTFVDRVEGLLFLAVVPFVQAAYLLRHDEPTGRLRRLATWSAGFVACFLLIAAPQVWLVSRQMGRFAINGRVVWSAVLAQSDGRPYEQKIYGLDYSPTQVNLTYLEAHPAQGGEFNAGRSPGQYTRLLRRNLGELYRVQANRLVGPVVLLLCCLGLAALLGRRQRFAVFVIAVFLATFMLGPLLHDVELRHVAVAAPLMLLVAGAGADWLTGLFVGPERGRLRWAASLALVAGAAVPWGRDLLALRSEPDCNYQYCIATIANAARVVRDVTDRELRRPPIVSARRQYLAYYSGGSPLAVPYSDSDGLVRFLHANRADFLFLEDWQLQGYPFMERGAVLPPRNFRLLYRQTDRLGRTSELYRVRSTD